MFYIQNKYGNDGYATWVKILRELAVTNNHWMNLSSPDDLMYLASKCLVSEEKLLGIISDLATFGEFNKELWEENKILFNQKFIENIEEAYKKRSNECFTFDDLCTLLHHLGIRKSNKLPLDSYGNTHRIEENKIEDNRIKEKRIDIADLLSEIVYPFESPEFVLSFRQWLEYKKEKRDLYSGKKSVEILLKKLSVYSAEFCIHLIEKSMSNNWKGLIFETTDEEFKNFTPNGNTKRITGQSGKKDFGSF